MVVYSAISPGAATGFSWCPSTARRCHGQRRRPHRLHLGDAQGLEAQGIHGEDGALIDHVELFADDDQADSRNFVMCPGKAYDRSPCGTGTSAKLACLAADGKLAEGQIWTQASITGSQFEGRFEWEGERVRPFITGRAYMTADATLADRRTGPFRLGHLSPGRMPPLPTESE
jgi:proline racemase